MPLANDELVEIWNTARTYTRRQFGDEIGDDAAQDMIVALLENKNAKRMENPTGYGVKIARFAALDILNPNRKTVDGKETRIVRDIPSGLLSREKGSSPSSEQLAIIREVVEELCKSDPEAIKAVLSGGVRMAACHPNREHKAHGLCSPCARKARRTGETNATHEV